MAWTLGSATHGWIGDGEGAVARARRAFQVSPFGPFVFFTKHMLAQGLYVSGDYKEAVAFGQQAAARNGLLTSNLRTLAASLVATGDVEAAHDVARRVMEIEPGFRLSAFAARTPFCRDVLRLYIPRLRAAGLPE